MARLILESGGERREIKVTGLITIGRSPEATVQVDDKTLSREHTQVYLHGGRVCVRDLGSKNGTYLNGSLVKQPEVLKQGDRIKVGPATFIVVLEAGDTLPAVQAAVQPPQPQPRPVTSHPPAQAAARPRPVADRERDAGGTSDFMVLAYRAFLVGVVVVGAYFTKPVFAWLLTKIPQ